MYNHHHHNKPAAAPSPESAAAADIFEQLCTASTFKSVLNHYRHLCDVLKLKPTSIRHFYPKLKSKLRSWKAQALWGKFDKRASHKCYNHGKSCPNTKVLIIGAGPCGLRTAIECQLLGAKVVVVEKRDRFSRNNVLHLWPFVINDLKQLGAKKFYGKFCAGAIDHISIRQLQCILLKVALLLGVEIFENVAFEEVVEPPEDQTESIGWKARLSPPEHPANQYDFDVLFGADGKRNTLSGFRRKEFRGKLAIAITANFINRRSEAEARVQEISGVAFIFNQKFFKELYAATGIDLENIVYYKDETHYFVMTAKKHSLIDKGVILRDLQDTQQLLHPSNVDRNALLDYAREAADFSTSYQLPVLDFAVNHYGKPDIAMFDFTSMFAAENACRMIERRGHRLITGLVGDSLLEPFWPTGSGCARGFLSSFDAAWMLRSLATEKVSPLEVLAERESIYRLLAQTTPENLGKDHSSYTIDPVSRYPTINLRTVLPFQVRSLFDTDDPTHLEQLTNPHLVSNDELPKKRKRRDSFIHPDTLLVWCKKQVALYDSVRIENMTTSFKDGRALCAIIHHYRPDLIEFEKLRPEDVAENNQLAYDILEREFGVPPVMTGMEMAECDVPDKLSMISYASQIFDVFRGEIPHYKYPKLQDDREMEVDKIGSPASSTSPHLNILKNLTNKAANTAQKKRLSERTTPKRDDGLISCHVLDDAGVIISDRKGESLKRNKKRKNERVTSPLEDEIEARQRREEILANRIERLKKQKEQRELDNVRFIRAMQMLKCGLSTPSEPSFIQTDDTGIVEYRKSNAKTMREKANDLEKKLFYCSETSGFGETYKPQVDQTLDFNDKVKGLEAKFIGSSSHHASDKKPKDLIRRIGKIEKSDWNVAAIEKKMHEVAHGSESHSEKEKVPKWSKDVYEDKFQNIEKRLRENGEDEETIAKYKDIDASLKRLEMKLREGSTLETGMRGQNKVSNLASQLSSKLEKKETEKVLVKQPSRPTVPLPTTGSDLCHFCGNRVYLVERLSAEGKFFHRQCFKCDYCAANLRLGNYIYDRDGRYGGKFFCIPHYGLSPRERGFRRKIEDTDSAKENIVPTSTSATPTTHLHVPGAASSEAATLIGHNVGKGGTPVTLSPEDRARGTTPERVEFENSMVEQSDEDEYLSEEEWTDRNFGASANELDDTDGEDDDSDFSDLSDEEAEDEDMGYLDRGGTLTAAETRRLAESWKRRYSTDHLDDDAVSGHDSESDLDSDNYSEEYGAEGDDSHTATEGEGGDDDDDEEEGEAVMRARELRRMEVNIDVAAPPRKAETSDSGSDTEVASDEETEESDTQIDTDSEFAEDHVQPGPPKSIPTIVIVESYDLNQDGTSSPVMNVKHSQVKDISGTHQKGEPRKDYVAQKVDLGSQDRGTNESKDNRAKEGAEKSASLTNLNDSEKVNHRAEQLKRLLQRTESTEAIAAKKALQLKRQYLLGEQTNLPRKSVSTADLGNRFKSFMDKISETQKMLNPAPQPSAAMQAFMTTSATSPKTPASSPSSPQLPARSISLPQGDASSSSTNSKTSNSSDVSVCRKEASKDFTTPIDSSVFPVEAINQSAKDKVKPIEQLKGFPVTDDMRRSMAASKETLQKEQTESESSSTESSSSSSESESDYDNVPSGRKHSVIKKSATAIGVGGGSVVNLDDKNKKENEILASTTSTAATDINNKACPNELTNVNQQVIGSNKEELKVSTDNEIINTKSNFTQDSDIGDDFGLSLPGESEGVETINTELVKVNAPRSLEYASGDFKVNCDKQNENLKDTSFEVYKGNESHDDVDELFDKLASEAVNDVGKFEELLSSPNIKPCSEETQIGDRNLGEPAGNLKPHKNKIELSDKRDKISDMRNSDSVKCETPSVHIIVEKSNETISQEAVHTDNNLLNRTKLIDCENLENRRLCKNESLSSPEGRDNTELELSDWAGDNDGISAGEELEVEVNERDRLGNTRKNQPKSIARIASEESLGDTDSAISTGPSKTTSVPSKPSVLADLEGIEYMDTSESASSPDEVPVKDGYRKLEEETPTTPVAPQMSLIDFEKVAASEDAIRESKSSDSTSTEMDDDDSSHSSVQEYLNNNIEARKEKGPREENIVKREPLQDPKSMSEPPSLCETKPKMNGEQRRDSLDDYVSSKRYEGYIPRFKERMSPFGYVRDSLDVRRSSTKSPAYTPTKQDEEDRKKNEERLSKLTLPTESKPMESSDCRGEDTKSVSVPNSVVSPNTAKKQIQKSLRSKDKDKEKDLIKEMVMSRISRKTNDKGGRRGSRTSNSPLSSTSSRTSLFSPQSSQENLLDRTDLSIDSNKGENDDNQEQKQVIRADDKQLLRLDSVMVDLPESGQTFAAEENRTKVQVGTIFREDSVLGTNLKSSDDLMSRSFDSSFKCNLPESGITFKAEEGRAKVKIGSAFRDDSILGCLGRSESLQDASVPFADDSQDEEVFERKDSKRIHLGVSSKTYHGRKASDPKCVNVSVKSNNEQLSSSHTNLPATPMTHPEKFGNTRVSCDSVPPSDTVPITPLRRNRPGKGMTTPLNSERPLSTPNLSTVDREKAREEARHRAKLKTDLDLGLSPPNLVDNLREKLRKGSVSETEDTSRDSSSRDVSVAVRQVDATPLRKEEPKSMNKDERVKQLLAEQREHRQREPSTQNKEEWSSKDDRVRERLEEYRQKRRGSTKNVENGESRPNSQLLRRPTHRPSLLELESLQVFTSSPPKVSSAPSSSSSSSTALAQSGTGTTSTVSTTPSQGKQVEPMMSQSPLSTGASSSISTTPASQRSQEPSSAEKAPEKKSGKKSKDRERRRSLIQVFAGMFSKSDDKKKGDQQTQDATDSTPSSKPTPPATIAPAAITPVETPKSAPKSPPLTVKDKLSRLRLSRSKDKKKAEKGRSNSADILDHGGSSDDTRSAFSLPTSPTRHPISSLTSSLTKASPPQASEESLSDDDGGSASGTPAGTLDRTSQAPWSGSTRKRSQAQKIARQAEMKRLRMAQEIQRQLEECEVKTRELEERGVAVEKSLRGENSGGNRDEADLISDWFSMVHEKNALVRWEQELMVRAKELELEDRHVRLEHELRHRMALSEKEKSREDIDREGTILAEMLNILEQKDALVTMLEEDRQRYMEEDRDLESVMLRKGLQLSPLRRETGV